jgi:flavin reductase (DIM6/NTAB) family NADH-FMN oxidoreductase RutF
VPSAPDPWSAAVPAPSEGPETPPSVDDRAFRDVMARLGSGVCVLATTDPVGRDCGLTVTAVASLSLVPPLVMVGVRHGSFVHDALYVADGFALTVLAAEQLDLARYASRHRYPTDTDDFAPWPTVRAKESGSLVFTGGLAAADCVPYSFVDAGDHSITIGRVVQTAFGCTGEVPLLHVDRRYYVPGQQLD